MCRTGIKRDHVGRKSLCNRAVWVENVGCKIVPAIGLRDVAQIRTFLCLLLRDGVAGDACRLCKNLFTEALVALGVQYL